MKRTRDKRSRTMQFTFAKMENRIALAADFAVSHAAIQLDRFQPEIAQIDALESGHFFEDSSAFSQSSLHHGDLWFERNLTASDSDFDFGNEFQFESIFEPGIIIESLREQTFATYGDPWFAVAQVSDSFFAIQNDLIFHDALSDFPFTFERFHEIDVEFAHVTPKETSTARIAPRQTSLIQKTEPVQLVVLTPAPSNATRFVKEVSTTSTKPSVSLTDQATATTRRMETKISVGTDTSPNVNSNASLDNVITAEGAVSMMLDAVALPADDSNVVGFTNAQIANATKWSSQIQTAETDFSLSQSTVASSLEPARDDRQLMSPRVRELGYELAVDVLADASSDNAWVFESNRQQANNSQSFPDYESTVVATNVYSRDAEATGFHFVVDQPTQLVSTVPMDPLAEFVAFDIFTAMEDETPEAVNETTSAGVSGWFVATVSFTSSLGWLLKRRIFETESQTFLRSNASNVSGIERTVRASAEWIR